MSSFLGKDSYSSTAMAKTTLRALSLSSLLVGRHYVCLLRLHDRQIEGTEKTVMLPGWDPPGMGRGTGVKTHSIVFRGPRVDNLGQ